MYLRKIVFIVLFLCSFLSVEIYFIWSSEHYTVATILQLYPIDGSSLSLRSACNRLQNVFQVVEFYIDTLRCKLCLRYKNFDP